MRLSNNALGILCAITCAFLWSILGIVLKYSLQFSDVETICWFRFAIALTFLWGYLLIKYKSKLFTYLFPFPWLSLIAGIGLTANYWGYFKCLELTSPSNAQILIQLAPLCLALIGLLVFKEKVSSIQKKGFFIAILGLCLFNGEQLSYALQNFNRYLRGNLVMLFSIIGWTSWGFFNKKIIAKTPISIANAIVFTVGAVCLLPTAQTSQFSSYTSSQWLIIGFLGLNTVIAYGLISKAFSLIDTNKVSFIITLNPLGTIVLMKILTAYDVKWIGEENIGPIGLLGALFLLTGVIMVVALKKTITNDH